MLAQFHERTQGSCGESIPIPLLCADAGDTYAVPASTRIPRIHPRMTKISCQKREFCDALFE